VIRPLCFKCFLLQGEERKGGIGVRWGGKIPHVRKQVPCKRLLKLDLNKLDV